MIEADGPAADLQASPLPSVPPRHAVFELTGKICGSGRPGDTGCVPGAEATARGPGACPRARGTAAFVWSPPGFFLAGIGSRGVERGQTCASSVVSLITPGLIDWIVRDNGIPLVVCDGPARCLLRQGGE